MAGTVSPTGRGEPLEILSRTETIPASPSHGIEPYRDLKQDHFFSAQDRLNVGFRRCDRWQQSTLNRRRGIDERQPGIP
jgi:hypothetical protein